MPEYSFACQHCNEQFTLFMTFADYNPSQKCPTCGGSDKVCRDYLSDNVSGTIALRTVGALADRNTSKLSEDEKEALWRKHNVYRLGPKPDLPEGMERVDKKNPTFDDTKKRKKPKRKVGNMTTKSFT